LNEEEKEGRSVAFAIVNCDLLQGQRLGVGLKGWDLKVEGGAMRRISQPSRVPTNEGRVLLRLWYEDLLHVRLIYYFGYDDNMYSIPQFSLPPHRFRPWVFSKVATIKI